MVFFDFTKLHFVLLDVFAQGLDEAFGVLRGQNDAAFYFCFGYIGHHSDEIDNEFRVGVRNDGEVGVDAFGYVFACARPIAEAIELSMYSSSRALVQVLNESEQVRAFFLQLAVLGNPREVRVTDEWNETSTLSVQEPHC